MKKDYVKIYGRSIFHIAQDFDFYLINQLVLSGSDDSKIIIDHVLFGEKFIYVIKDHYYTGGVSAKENDRSWLYYSGSKKNLQKKYIDNPLKVNKLRVKKMSQITGIDESLLISIVLINNDCALTPFEGKSKNNFLVTRKGLKKLVKAIESRDVEPINDDQLKFAVKDIAKLNLRKKK